MEHVIEIEVTGYFGREKCAAKKANRWNGNKGDIRRGGSRISGKGDS